MDLRARIQQGNDELFAAWNAHNPDDIAMLHAEDAGITDITSGIATHGRNAIRQYAADRFAGFPDLWVERLDLLIDASASAHTWVMRGTQNGEYEGLPPSGRVVEISGATFSRFDERCMIAGSVNYVDVAAYLRQLGLS